MPHCWKSHVTAHFKVYMLLSMHTEGCLKLASKSDYFKSQRTRIYIIMYIWSLKGSTFKICSREITQTGRKGEQAQLHVRASVRRTYAVYYFKNRLRTPKLHIKDVPRSSENSLVRPKMDIETSCLQKKPAHIYQIT